MRRTVFYPVHAGAAGAAASLLADEFDMRKLGPDEVVASTVPLVFLADADGPDRPPGPNVRVIGLVDPRRPGTWPEHSYGLLWPTRVAPSSSAPAPTPSPIWTPPRRSPASVAS